MSTVLPSDIVIISGRVVRALMNCQLRAMFSTARIRSTVSPAMVMVLNEQVPVARDDHAARPDDSVNVRPTPARDL
jgi:hypothetical protein